MIYETFKKILITLTAFTIKIAPPPPALFLLRKGNGKMDPSDGQSRLWGGVSRKGGLKHFLELSI